LWIARNLTLFADNSEVFDDYYEFSQGWDVSLETNHYRVGVVPDHGPDLGMYLTEFTIVN